MEVKGNEYREFGMKFPENRAYQLDRDDTLSQDLLNESVDGKIRAREVHTMESLHGSV